MKVQAGEQRRCLHAGELEETQVDARGAGGASAGRVLEADRTVPDEQHVSGRRTRVDL